jgi:hypothetical protein
MELRVGRVYSKLMLFTQNNKILSAISLPAETTMKKPAKKIKSTLKFSIIHIPCNRMSIQYLFQQTAQTIVNSVTYVPATCFDLCNFIFVEV